MAKIASHPLAIEITRNLMSVLVTLCSAGTETLLRRKYPHIYTLSISIYKNQSMKVRGALYISANEYNYKVITGCDTIL